MKKSLLLLLIPASLLFVGCPGEPADVCEDFYGTYVGTLSGAPLTGQLTIYVSKSWGTVADVTGVWTASNGLTGEINRCDLNCNSGNFSYEYGLSLNGPWEVICPDDNVGAPGCYSSGATLGRFEGKLTSTGGSGSWQANSGAAGTVGVVGSGTWNVTRQ